MNRIFGEVCLYDLDLDLNVIHKLSAGLHANGQERCVKSVLDFSPNQLTEFVGIGPKSAQKIVKALNNIGYFWTGSYWEWRYFGYEKFKDEIKDVIDVAYASRTSSIEALNKIDRLKTRFNGVDKLNKETRDAVDELKNICFDFANATNFLDKQIAEVKELKELLENKQGFWSKLFGRGK